MISNYRPEGRLSTTAILLGIALVWFVLVGGTQFGSFHTPIKVINSAIGATMIGCWLWRMPRRADRTDVLLLGALVAFLLACVASNFPRLSYEAATSAMAYAAAASLARWEVADRRSARALVTVLGACSLGLLLIFLPLWISVWSAWFSVTGSAPPLNLRLPVGPFFHYHAVAMLFALLLPALLQLTFRRLANVVAYAGIGLSLILIYGAGSRTVWLGVALGMFVPLVVTNGVLSRRMLRAAAVGLAVVAVLAATGLLDSFISRLTTASTVALRFEIWSASLDQWLRDPLFGTGPGTFSTAFTLSDYFQRYVSVGRHPDNALVQLVMEAGLLGILSLGLVGAALVVGIRDANGRWARPALMGLAIFGFLSMTNGPASAGYYLIPIGLSWAALCTPALGPPLARAWSPTWRTALIGLSALIVTGSTGSLLAGSAAFDRSQQGAETGGSAQTLQALDQAIAFDPAFAMYWRERGLHTAETNLASAIDDLRHASEISPADTAAIRALAILELRSGNSDEALHVAGRAAALRPTDVQNLTTLAFVASMTNNQELARGALVNLLRRTPWIAASPLWAGHFPVGLELRDLLLAADHAWDERADGTVDTVATQVWLHAMIGGDMDELLSKHGWEDSLNFRALDALMRCDEMRAGGIAEQLRTTMGETSPATAIMIARWIDPLDPVEDEIALADVRMDSAERLAVSRPPNLPIVWDSGEDQRIYERGAVVPTDLGLLLPTEAEGLSAWLRDPKAAAELGAPGSGLAECDP